MIVYCPGNLLGFDGSVSSKEIGPEDLASHAVGTGPELGVIRFALEFIFPKQTCSTWLPDLMEDP